MSCENLDFESLSDTEYVRECFYLYLNNEPLRAIDLLEKRKEKSLITNYGHVFIHFVSSIISFNRTKLSESSVNLKELERKCTVEQPGWLASLKSKVFRNQQRYVDWQTLLDELDREIILADTLLCATVLQILESNYIKSILSIRRAFKIYTQTFKQINDLCNQYAVVNEPSEIADTGSVSEFSNAYTVPLESFTENSLSTSSQKLSKSQQCITQNEYRYFSKNYLLPVLQNEVIAFKAELLRLRGAIYFGYGAIQLAFSFLPSHLKVINFLGYEGDETVAINCLHQSKNSTDFRNVLAVIGLLWYYLVLVPFFSLEHSDLSKEIQTATDILNENEQLDQSALFLYFSGRRQRLKKKIRYAIMHYDAAIRQKTIPRELKIHIMYELGVCLLIQLNYHDAMHYFNELKTSKFSKSFYIYLTIICHGAFEHEKYENFKEDVEEAVAASSNKDGIIERFIKNRCNVLLNDEKKGTAFWQLLCFEVIYLWNLLSSCDIETLQNIINICEQTSETNEPIIGLAFFICGSCYKVLRDAENALKFYTLCIQKCNDNLSQLQFHHIPAYANLELSNLYKVLGNEEKAQNHLMEAQQFKNFDFEQRLRLKTLSNTN
ncbi:hypothetical protein PVAND_011563 [Polypedilum vanderplanki]|uniref:Uncharacterized protein n=1 Tax=Polypedilum vanderplanki TaxID=319348 RepID=A0A9J6CKI4_POLVA|nr:hypothetical protein PVAND_011563 [Polypedilum vanderplanki]